ncbi:MAG: hypothetical protein AB3N28_12815 [Kordiimonas sp.]
MPTTSKFKKLTQSKTVHAFLRLLQAAAVIGVLYLMAEKLAAIGWQDVSQSMPTTPWFYVFFLGMYFAQPVSEWLVYQRLWGTAVKKRLDIFVRMRIYNFALVSYVGEAFLALWAHKNLSKGGKQVMSSVKDSSILSGLASNSFTLILLALFFMTGQLEAITNADPNYGKYLGFAVILGLILIPLVLKFHSRILGITSGVARKVFAIHLSRLIAVLLFQTAQWAVVFPEVAITTWLLILTAQMILTRIPFLPNTDLLFAGLGMTLMGYVDGPEAAVAGMFLASGALSQVLNLGCFIITSFKRNTPITQDTDTKLATEKPTP